MVAVLMPPSTGFAGRLKALRSDAGLTQARLAELAGLHPLAIAKLERGEREPTWATVLAIAKALNVSVSAFVAEGEAASETPPRPKRKPRRRSNDGD
jgi:transcriptional regulator with XRE-family HTH domain